MSIKIAGIEPAPSGHQAFFIGTLSRDDDDVEENET